MRGAFAGKEDWFALCLIVSVVAGLLVRGSHFLGTGFPLNDGGLFVVMISSIKSAGYILPEFVEFNRLQIPFAYPPLALYLGAVVSDLAAVSVVTVVRYLPLYLSVLSVAVFCLLVATLRDDRVVVLYASLFFALLPKVYQWTIMGGGITRSAGLLFTLAASWQAARIALHRGLRGFVWCGLLVGAAVLSHPEWGITATVSVSLILLHRDTSRRGLGRILVIGAVAVMLVAPWVIAVSMSHGLSPFLSAARTSTWGVVVPTLQAAIALFASPLGLVALVGLVGEIRRREWLLTTWLIAICLSTPRQAQTAMSIPLAILSAEGLRAISRLIADRIAGRLGSEGSPGDLRRLRSLTRRHCGIPSYALLLGGVAAAYLLTVTLVRAEQLALESLSGGELGAMEWVSEHTTEDSRFIVLTESKSWADDSVSEWFPVVAERESLLTVQGREWLGGDAFERTRTEIGEIKELQQADPGGLLEYVESHHEQLDYVALLLPGVEPSYGGFLGSGRYRVVYESDSAVVLEAKTQ